VYVSVYVPVAAGCAPAITGFCCVEVKPFGPAQEYVAPLSVAAKRVTALPCHTGLFEVAGRSCITKGAEMLPGTSFQLPVVLLMVA